MNLKIRFLLLIIGTFIIPNALIMLTVWLSFGSIENLKATHEQLARYYQLYELIDNEVDPNEFATFVKDLPPEMNARILDGDSQKRNEIFTDFIARNKNGNIPKVTLEALTVTYKNGDGSVLIINRPLIDKYSIFRNKPLPFIFTFILYSVITLLSLILIRSINISLKRIEEATRKVAEGDFEFELKTKGNDSIASLARSFDIMRRKVKDEYDRRARFFMSVSHDLKTPLTSISGYADAVLAGYAEDKETLNKYMEIIRSKTNLLSSRISQLIHFVKLETRDWKETFEPVMFRTFLRDLLESFKLEASLYKHTFEYELDIPYDIKVIMDRELVVRSFENLLHNAYRYSYPGSVVTFTAVRKGEGILLSVVNRGEGIERDDLFRIFEPFYRGLKGRNDEGFGLGLANVAAVIKSHGWEISAVSELKKETTFTIIVPIV
ncbi:MAG: HAMP domain-containing histidine kinase [Spirochaetales bacterium]|nr:HAMP domain-containing histidine kinase [Spirochaetales bacterium]